MQKAAVAIATAAIPMISYLLIISEYHRLGYCDSVIL
jgi:hypothetical protein